MKRLFYFCSFFIAPSLFAGLSYKTEGTQKKAEQGVEKTAQDVQKALVNSSLRGIDARLRVEGARFRKFNLYLPETKMAPGIKPSAIFREVRTILERDLALVGAFNFVSVNEKIPTDELLKQKGVEGISTLSFSMQTNVIRASVSHKNLATNTMTTKNFNGTSDDLRRLAHLLAQSIYEEFIGPENLFVSQIVAIKQQRSGESHVVLLDFDGQNERIIADGKWLKSTPSFSLDGKSVLYAVNAPETQGIVEQAIGSKQFQFRTKRPGLVMEPRVMPDNSGMLVTHMHDNKAHIYRTTRLGTIISSLTTGGGLNLSPTISADGKEMAFVSDRSGNPQIYVSSLVADLSKPLVATRVTFKGNYNQTPQFSPDGKLIVFTGRDEEKIFDIFLLERTGRTSRVTQYQGNNQEPIFSPSGNFVLFTSAERQGKVKRELFIATLNGDHQYCLTDANNNANTLGYWSPAIKDMPIN